MANAMKILALETDIPGVARLFTREQRHNAMNTGERTTDRE
jgi:hypothetical protein